MKVFNGKRRKFELQKLGIKDKITIYFTEIKKKRLQQNTKNNKLNNFEKTPITTSASRRNKVIIIIF